MSKRNIIWLLAFVTYLVAACAGVVETTLGFAAIIAVTIVSALLGAGLIVMVVLNKREEVFKETMVEWISALVFVAFELIFVVTLRNKFMLNVSFVVELLAALFAMYIAVKYVVVSTNTVKFVKEKVFRKGAKKEETSTEEVVAEKVEEPVTEEVNEVAEEVNEEVQPAEPEVLGIECSKEEVKEEMPYFEEETK